MNELAFEPSFVHVFELNDFFLSGLFASSPRRTLSIIFMSFPP